MTQRDQTIVEGFQAIRDHTSAVNPYCYRNEPKQFYWWTIGATSTDTVPTEQRPIQAYVRSLATINQGE